MLNIQADTIYLLKYKKREINPTKNVFDLFMILAMIILLYIIFQLFINYINYYYYIFAYH